MVPVREPSMVPVREPSIVPVREPTTVPVREPLVRDPRMVPPNETVANDKLKAVAKRIRRRFFMINAPSEWYLLVERCGIVNRVWNLRSRPAITSSSSSCLAYFNQHAMLYRPNKIFVISGFARSRDDGNHPHQLGKKIVRRKKTGRATDVTPCIRVSYDVQPVGQTTVYLVDTEYTLLND